MIIIEDNNRSWFIEDNLEDDLEDDLTQVYLNMYDL